MNPSLAVSTWGRRVETLIQRGNRKFRPEVDTKRWKLVRGDFVQVIQGPQTGQQGKIGKVLRDSNRVIIEGVNMRSRVMRSMDGSGGKKVIRPCSVHYSNIMLVDPSTNEPTKANFRYLENGTKVRISKKSGNIVAKPEPLLDRKPRSIVLGPKDTKPDDVFKVTFTDYEKYLPYIYASMKK